jgi:fatty-acyl-CoA synthase
MSQASATIDASLTLSQRFAQLAQQSPQALALVDGNGRLSYGQLHRLCVQQRQQLQARGVHSGDVVGLLAHNSMESLALLAACDELGALFMPLNWRLAPTELDQQLADAQARWLFYDPHTAALAQQLKFTQVSAAHVERLDALGNPLAGTNQLPTPPSGSATEPLLLVYTSGSTGAPKGALHSRAQLWANAQASWHAHEMSAKDKVLSALPLFHVGGLCIQTLPALLLGATVFLQSRFEPTAFLAAIEREQITVSLMVPPVMSALLGHPQWASTDFSSVRIMMAGSSIVPPQLLQAFHARTIAVGQVYGATETGPVTIVLAREACFARVGFAGWPAKDVEVRLLNAREGVGELWVRGPNVMLGYLGSPRLQDSADGWHATGDLAQIDEQGCVKIVGRSSDLIISGGENIHPVQLEQLLLQLPQISDCAVIGVPHERWGEAVVACLVAQVNVAPTMPARKVDNSPVKLQSRLSDAAIINYLEQHIARFKLPQRFVWLDQLPKSALGKVLKAQLRQIILSQ